MRTLALLVVLCACNNAQPPAPTPTPSVRVARPEIAFVELRPHGATDASPLLIAFHGMGDTPENFAAAFEDFPAAAEILVPRGIHPRGDGFAWYRLGSPAEMAADIRNTVDAVWPAIKARAKGRPIFVTGFSQGGVMTFALARYRPTEIAHAFPIAGRLMPELETAKGDPPPAPTDAYHGTADTMISFEDGQRAIDAFKAAGGTATMHAYPDVPHTLMPMRSDLFAAIVAAFPAQ